MKTRLFSGGMSGKTKRSIAGKQTEEVLSGAILSSLYNNNVKKLNVPRTRGCWKGVPGDSNFYPDDLAMFYVGHGRWLSGKRLKELYQFTSVSYHHSIPDFMPFADKVIDVISLNTRPLDRKTSYQLAEEWCVNHGSFKSIADIRNYKTQNDLVWHECDDGLTMIAVPMAINQAFTHTGGIGINNGLKKIGSHFRYVNCCALTHKKIQGTFRKSKP